MPIEIRRLLFSEDELLQALLDMNTRSGHKHFPEGTISDLKIGEAPSPTVTFVAEQNRNYKEEVTIATNTLGAALIGYCMRQHIPLPTHADKSLSVVKGRVVMDIKMCQSQKG